MYFIYIRLPRIYPPHASVQLHTTLSLMRYFTCNIVKPFVRRRHDIQSRLAVRRTDRRPPRPPVRARLSGNTRIRTDESTAQYRGMPAERHEAYQMEELYDKKVLTNKQVWILCARNLLQRSVHSVNGLIVYYYLWKLQTRHLWAPTYFLKDFILIILLYVKPTNINKLLTYYAIMFSSLM